MKFKIVEFMCEVYGDHGMLGSIQQAGPEYKFMPYENNELSCAELDMIRDHIANLPVTYDIKRKA